LTIDPPAAARDPNKSEPGLPVVGGGVMFRGRAAEKLVNGLPRQPWRTFTSCPYENLTDPGRVHLDPFGNLHLCQGIVMGNLFEKPLKEILDEYDPQAHPIVGPLLKGGPAQLVATYDIDHGEEYVDACHLCYRAREALRPRFPAQLRPDQMYGVTEN
jgi:MoaA/NifB/PqqE/SkfB family radical SAM enzyme